MKFLIAIGVFFIALLFSTPFFGALMLAIGAGFLVHFLAKSDERQARGPTVAEQLKQEAALAEGVPDGSNPPVLREYLRGLAQRISALEAQAGTSQPDAAAAPMRAPIAPVEAAVDPVAPIVVPAPADMPREMRAPVAAAESIHQAKERAERAHRAKERAEQIHQAKEQMAEPETAVEAPSGPSFFSRLVSGNIVAKAGAIILFLGVGFLLKLAYDRNMVPPEMRLLGVAAAAAGVFLTGWRLRERRRLYGLILQGVASGLAYIDVFFALKTYGFIGPVLGFSLFALLGVATTMLAVRQDAKPLAVLGLFGAFVAPILASTGSGNHVFLFSYYLLLNLFIVAVSWFKSWRALNLTGWFFTLAVAALWGSRSYTPALFGTIEPFLLAFFAIYLVLPILFAMRQPPELKGLVDGTLVFGTPAAVAAIQAKLVWDMAYGLAWSSAVGAALYAVLSVMVLRHKNMRLLGETYIALAVGLGTLAIFFAFGAYVTFALWTIEGTAILWVCLRQKHLLGRLFAILVQFAGAAYFFLDYSYYERLNPWFNDAVLGCAIIAAASFLSASLIRRHRDEISEGEQPLAAVMLAWGAFCWSLGGLDVIHHAVQDPGLKPAIAILFFSASIAVAELLGARGGWGMLRGLAAVHPLVLAAAALAQLSEFRHPLADLGWLAWPIGLGSLFWVLHRQRRDGFDAMLQARYAGGWLILAGLATWEAGWWLDKREYLYCMALALAGYAVAALRYRLREHDTDNARFSTLPLLWAMAFWFAAGFLWIERRLPDDQEVRVALLFVAGTALLYELAHSALEWPALRMAARLPWLAIPVAFIAEIVSRPNSHPFGDGLALAWPAALGLAFWALRREEKDGEYFATGPRHMIALYTVLALATWELTWWLIEWKFGYAWRFAALGVPASLALLAVTAARDSGRWPLDAHWPLYRGSLLAPIALGLALWTLASNVKTPGTLDPLSIYLPLLNPIDVSIALAAFAVTMWGQCIESLDGRRVLWKGMTALGFLWLNAIALRSIHYWDDVPYRFADLMHSVPAQATLSILWTSAALGLMLLARHRMDRQPWIVGAALLAAVVGKLFLVDLANTGTVARIVSFVGVGAILLVIGYLAPVPPGIKESESR